jgi:DNA-binding response OmpR family regulator
MTGMDGFRVGRLLRSVPGCGMTLVIAVTGYTAEAYRARGREAGFDHYLIKPIDPGPLKSLLMRHVGRSAAKSSRVRVTDPPPLAWSFVGSI